jgi:beta-glucosidase
MNRPDWKCAVYLLLAAAQVVAQPLAAPNEEQVRSRADALIAAMSSEEKAGQMADYFYFAQSPAGMHEIDQRLERGQVGALLFVTDPAQTNRLQRVAVEKSPLKIPLLFGYDVIHGLKTIFPVPIGLAASWDPTLVEHVQAVAATEARAVGIDWTFAPNVDIARDPRWGRMVEGAGEDPYLGASMAAAQVRGFQGPFIGALTFCPAQNTSRATELPWAVVITTK